MVLQADGQKRRWNLDKSVAGLVFALEAVESSKQFLVRSELFPQQGKQITSESIQKVYFLRLSSIGYLANVEGEGDSRDC